MNITKRELYELVILAGLGPTGEMLTPDDLVCMAVERAAALLQFQQENPENENEDR